MISTLIRRASMSAIVLGVASPMALCQRSFVFPHALERDGRLVAIGWDLSGGQTEYRWTVDATGPIVTRTIAPIGALYSLYGNDDLFQMVSEALQGRETGNTYSMYSTQKGVAQVGLGFAHLVSVSLVQFPECDVDSKDPAGIEVYFNPKELTVEKQTNWDTKLAADVAKKQKMWSPANFRLTIGDLPCSRVRKISSITVRPPNHDPEAKIRLTPMDTEVGLADAAPFREALRKSIGGLPVELPFRLDYLDEDGNVLLSMLSTVVIVSVDKSNPLDPFDLTDPANGEKPMTVKYHHKGHVTVLK